MHGACYGACADRRAGRPQEGGEPRARYGNVSGAQGLRTLAAVSVSSPNWSWRVTAAGVTPENVGFHVVRCSDPAVDTLRRPRPPGEPVTAARAGS